MLSVFGSLVGEAEIKNVVDCMKSQWMGFGNNVEAFEKKYCEKYGFENFAMVDSGSNALFMAVTLLDLPKGSEVIVPSFTWVSCAQAVLLAGHKPVFCDVDLATMNVRKKDVEAVMTDKTKAIMVVDYAGLAVDIDSIREMGLPIIEDAAHAVHSTYKGRACGVAADVAIFSYDAVKNLTVGEGGGITANNPEMIERAKMLRYCGIGKSGFQKAASNASANKGRWWEYEIKEPFIKMLPTNIAAGIGIAQLDNIDKLQDTRKQIWDYYQQELKAVSGLTLPVEADTNERHSYFTYGIRGPKRDELASFLLDNQIYTTLRYHPLHLNKLYGQTDVRLKNCEILNEDSLSIPLHPRMSLADAELVVNKIKEFYKK